MTHEQISALLSLLAALVMTAVNFYPWYSTTYDGAPKVKKWGKIILFLCTVLVIGSGIVLFYPKKNIENNNVPEKKEISENSSHSNNVKLIYNNSTGELYPILPEDSSVHSCVWTIWGDHGSQTVVITKSALLDKSSDPVIELNSFLPPRVPIYMTCIDWENNAYSGVIGEY